MMSQRTEDLLGKGLLVFTFTLLAYQQALSFARTILAADRPDFWWLDILSRTLTLLFVAIVVVMTIRRLPARATAAGLEPRITAIAGTFTLMLLAFLPHGDAGVAAQFVATVLIAIGTALSIHCLRYLGRSFSVMATARELVTGGPYARVRHPLYVAEAITTIGIVILHWSIGAVALGLIQALLQFRRMQNEEAVLRAAFPEYASYAARVPMIIPRLAI
ncbi:protein-S-isoprenylcysteine methyltransferase [Polymorphobacter glacialis]|uniref:Protein-S-isoprenylcysteine methyltransferase n=1 Tax=Sandarakinorhabdus glacialis TaxID=1614636 RepID=A0A916ZZL9_9SPHN|nr:isoprenylcysteine carboxylmethyltransferase family protein [Polymorphobacter glacialis]GGE19726.1 protein-S-isoprenylcysteine methyltransferase [Polymorphobacter glacialis]